MNKTRRPKPATPPPGMDKGLRPRKARVPSIPYHPASVCPAPAGPRREPRMASGTPDNNFPPPPRTPQEARERGQAEARRWIESLTLEQLFHDWQRMAAEWRETHDTTKDKLGVDGEWWDGLLATLADYCRANAAKLNHDAAGMSYSLRRDIEDFKAKVQPKADAEDAPCSVCGWHHDPGLTSFSGEGVEPFTLTPGKSAHKAITLLHEHMEKNRGAAMPRKVWCDAGLYAEPYEIFRRTKAWGMIGGRCKHNIIRPPDMYQRGKRR